MISKATCKTALPYLLLAVVFAVLAGRASIGYCSVEEGATVALVDRLYNGAVPYVDEWLSIQSFAIVLLPFYTLWMHVTGNIDTVIYFFRLLFVLAVFAASVFGYRVLRKNTGELVATVAAVAALLCLGSNNDGFSCYNLCGLCLMVSGLCAWCTWLQMRADDGTQTGYKRLLWPIACGAFAATAASCDLGILPLFIVSILTAALIAAILRNPKVLIPFAWATLGYMVVLCMFFIYLLGFTDPVTLAQSMAAAFNGSHGLSFGDGAQKVLGIPARQACLSILMFCFVIAVGIVNEMSILRRTVWQDALCSFVLLVVIVCCFLAGYSGVSNTDEDITSGVYLEDTAQLLDLASGMETDDSVWCVVQNSGAYLVLPGLCDAPTVGTALVTEYEASKYYNEQNHERPEWIVLQNPDTINDDEALSKYIKKLARHLESHDGYAPLKTNSFGTIYKRASSKSYMTQAG